eukprot:2277332-Heterocapsa_arctica.AAC.1
MELEGGQEKEAWEVWLEHAKKRSEENLQKAIEEASKQGCVPPGGFYPAQEVWITPDKALK